MGDGLNFQNMLNWGYNPQPVFGMTPVPTSVGVPPALQLPEASIWDSPFAQKRADGSSTGGFLAAGMGLAQGLGSLYLGMQQYNLAKDSLRFQKDSFNKDYAARVKDYNSQLEDRQRARVASNPGAYQSVGAYMDQNRMGG